MEPKQLAELLDILRTHGVTEFSTGSLRIVMTSTPPALTEISRSVPSTTVNSRVEDRLVDAGGGILVDPDLFMHE